MKTNYVKRIFIINIAIVLTLLFIILYMFNSLNTKYDQNLYHKTTIIKGLFTIKYKVTASHLWFAEYISGDKKELNRLNEEFLIIEKQFDELIMFEKNYKNLNNSKDKKKITQKLKKIYKEFKSFKESTMQIVNNDMKIKNFDDVSYDLKYEKLMMDLEIFDSFLDRFFENINRKYVQTKYEVNMIVFLLIVLAIFIFYLVSIAYDKNIKQLRQKDHILAEKDKLASIGEMIDAIIHQWKTPLSVIRLHAQVNKMDIEESKIAKENLEDSMNVILEQIDHLATTTDEFRNFFRPNTKTQNISLCNLIESTSKLMKGELIKNNIKIKTNCIEDSFITINANEFKHVLINLIQNSKDAFIENKIQNRKITFDVHNKNDKAILEIRDNAGGIPEDVIGDIFKPNFTTKEEDKGTGIGLYLSMQIVEKYNGKIYAKNIVNGVCFFIEFNN